MSLHQPDPNKASQSKTVDLPPGFRFHPTDDELVFHYLTRKVANSSTVFQAIGELNFNKCEPWDFPAKAKMGHQGAFYFFSLTEKKYGNSRRTNRATKAGHWKTTGKERVLIAKSEERMLGFRKTLVFYMGSAAKGERTNWIMNEYRLEARRDCTLGDQREWVVCRVFDKSVSKKRPVPEPTANADWIPPQTPLVPTLSIRIPESTAHKPGHVAEDSTKSPKSLVLPSSSRIWTLRVPILRNQIPKSTTYNSDWTPPVSTTWTLIQATLEVNDKPGLR